MATETTNRFMKALDEAERTRRLEPLVEMFADDAELTSAVRHTTQRGRQGAESFWREYLGAFQHVHSEFKDVIESKNQAALTWRAEAVLSSGKPIVYEGVTLLELQDNHVARFKTFYDPTPFMPLAAAHSS
jgi:ketosteroid isomerase-like protein